MPPFFGEVYDERNVQPGFVQIAFPPGETAAVVAEYEDDGIVIQSLLFQVFEKETYPFVHILHGF